MIVLLVLTVTLAGVYWIYWQYKNRRLLAMAAKMPGPPTLPLLGNALYFTGQSDGLITVLKTLINEYGDVLRFWLGPDLNIVVSNPDDLKTLLTNTKTSVKGPQYKYMAEALGGGGILTGSGSSWRKHRKIATPNYGKRAIESYSKIFNNEAVFLIENLKSMPKGKHFDIYYDIVRTTSYAVCQTLMGLSREQSLNIPYMQEIIDCTPMHYDIVYERMTKWYLQIDPIFRLSKYNKHQNNFKDMISNFSNQILSYRMEKLKTMNVDLKTLVNFDENSTRNTEISVIDRLILSNELNALELVKETFTVFTSSQEATAKITSFLILMMAYHPKCQEKLYSEILSIIGISDRTVADEDLRNMPYLEMVFKEVLRMFPIGALLQRTITEDMEIGSWTLPGGCSLVVPIYHMHRDPRFWTRPEEFDPERFSPENTKERHPNCYIPFSLGPMDCLGRYFGAKLVKTIAIRILQEFRVTSLDSYKDMKLLIAISVASVNGYQVALHPRN